jgi:hypothetical protein
MFNPIPEWIKNYPVEIERKALIWIYQKYGQKRFNEPFKTTFTIYNIKSQQDADAMRDRAEKAGWAVQEHNVKEDPKIGKVLESTKVDYLFTKDTYMGDSIFFRRLAEQYGALYDGWFVEVKK